MAKSKEVRPDKSGKSPRGGGGSSQGPKNSRVSAQTCPSSSQSATQSQGQAPGRNPGSGPRTTTGEGAGCAVDAPQVPSSSAGPSAGPGVSLPSAGPGLGVELGSGGVGGKDCPPSMSREGGRAIDMSQVTSGTANSSQNSYGTFDCHRLLYSGFPEDPTSGADAAGRGIKEYAYVFSLDDVRRKTSDSGYWYESGSRASGKSVTAASGGYKAMLDRGYNKFTAPMWGGFDGWDITKPDPAANSLMGASSTEDNDYVYHTYRQALETVADVELLDFNLLATPGLTNNALTRYSIQLCEDRADAMALIDLENVYTPTHETYKARENRANRNVTNAANDLRDRRIDSSYGATFYPWVQTRDANSGQLVWIPPTVAMMGVLASSESKAAVWFAPAGFNRGGLSDGAAGIPITNVTSRLSSKDRDTLYEARINPIASFPSSGIVVFGQKTLQERQSALDRINVRRLVIYLKKQISVLSTQILFEQNVEATWDRFKALIEPFLANVKTQFGISEYRLVLDSSTTTPDLIDQNILYAKIMIKPARAIEFIAIDFVIASTGASFDD